MPSLPPSGPICIFGTGGFARDTFWILLDAWRAAGQPTDALAGRVAFVVSDDQMTEAAMLGVEVLRESAFDPTRGQLLVAVAEPAVRRRIVARLPVATTYATLLHPTAVVAGGVTVGVGSIVAAGAVLTNNIVLGRHAHVNVHASIAHDCRIGDFLTAAPGARINGNCTLGDGVYVGANAALRQGLAIADGVTIGMGAVVVKPILEAGAVYVGNPAVRLRA